MGDYNVKIAFTKEQVHQINTDGFKLCFTSGMGADPAFNVIAWCDTIAGHVGITWQAKYKIAATKDQFSDGATFNIATDTTDIQFKQDYTLPSDWTDGKISPNTGLDQGSFKFINQTNDRASVVVYKVIKGTPTPFYISQSPVFSQGTEVLTPRLSVALWFQKKADTGTMVSKSSSNPTVFDMSTTNTIELGWNGAGFVLKSD